MGGMLNSADIGKMIRNFRQSAGLSQEGLAEKIGVTFQQIQKYESGYTTLNIIRLQQIALALNVAVSDFFDITTPTQLSLTEQEEDLLKAFRKVRNTEMRQSLLKLLNNINKRVK
jgi:transcriptional regulator with XRE-family HTH domain